MPDVEFLTGDGSGSDPDEDLDTGPRRPVPWWVLLAGALAVVGLIVTVLVHREGSGVPVALPSTPPPLISPSGSPPTSAVVHIAPNLPAPGDYTLLGDDGDHRLFAVAGARLFAFGVNGLPEGNGVGLGSGASAVPTQLVLDNAEHVVFAVPHSETRGAAQTQTHVLVEAFDTRTLRPRGRSAVPGLIESAAVLDRSLYLSTTDGLFRLAGPGTPPDKLAGTQAADDQLVADPERDRLIAVDTAANTARFLRPGRSPSAPRRLTHGILSLAVVGDTIWGTSVDNAGRPEFAGLDPSTLRPGRDLADGVDVTITATGRRSLYVTLGNRTSGNGLRCLDGSTGRVLHDFGRVHGEFASVDGRGFLGSISALHPVAMGRCPG